MADHDEHSGGRGGKSDAHADTGHKKHKKHHPHAHEEHEHEEGWIVSFADNVLLQMGFFVILLAMNMGTKASGPVTEGEGTTAAMISARTGGFIPSPRKNEGCGGLL